MTNINDVYKDIADASDENMLNKARKDYAYTIIDATEGTIPAAAVEKVNAVDGVIRVRVID